MTIKRLTFLVPIVTLLAGLMLFNWVSAASAASTGPSSSSEGTSGQAETSCRATAVVTNDNDSGAGSLRDAVASLVCVGGTVTFAPEMDGETVLLASEIDVEETITISAETLTNPLAVTISGNNVTRIFHVTSGDLTLQHLTLTNGFAQRGGAVLNAGRLTVHNTVFASNEAFVDLSGTRTGAQSAPQGGELSNGGGAIFNSGTATLIVHDSTFFDNRATIDGGAILVNSGSAEINNSDFISNTASDGGGLYNRSRTTVTNGDVQGNRAERGGGFFNGPISTSQLTLIATDVTGNSTSGDGGGVHSSHGTLTIYDSLLAGNRAESRGGAIRQAGVGTGVVSSAEISNTVIISNSAFNGAGLYIDAGHRLTLTQSMLSNNSADANGGALINEGATTLVQTTVAHNSASIGAGLVNQSDGLLDIFSSTVSNNSATNGGGITYFSRSAGGHMRLENSTVSGNFANLNGSGIATDQQVDILHSSIVSNTGNAQGLQIRNGAVVTLTNSIVAYHGTDCALFGATLNPSHSLIADGSCDIADGDGDGSNLAADPLLDPLADNGGATKTHALQTNSPAIGAASFFRCPDTDQRGVARSDFICDMGAFERPCDTARIVINGDNSGAGSLRQAVIASCDGGEVTFAESMTNMTVTLAFGIGIGKPITIDGENRAVTISGEEVTQIFHVGGTATLTLTHLTIANGHNLGDREGGAILNLGTLIIDHCLFINNRNPAFTNGAGRDEHTILPSSVRGETPLVGGAIFNSGHTAMRVSNSTFIDNVAEDSGGAIATEGGSDNVDVISNTRFINNRARNGGAIYLFDAAVELVDVTLENNQATDGNGGGIHANSPLTITQSSILSNTAATDGGGIYYQPFQTGISIGVHIEGSTIEANAAQAEGGGLFVSDGTATVDQTLFADNHSLRGGAIYNDDGTLIVRDSRLEENRASSTDVNSVEDNGGAIRLAGADSSAEIFNSEIISNRADLGGGIFAGINTSLTISRSSVSNNSATVDGGGMIVRGVTTIAQSTVANNSASGIGGGIRLQANTGGGSSLSLVNSTVSGNSADLQGSGIAANAPLSIFFSTIASNIGQANGVQVDSGSLTIENSILANNDNLDCAASAPIVGIFSSLVADGSCGVVNDGDNIVADPLLGSLADNGGPTLTHALLLNSPAIGDADIDDCPTIDQRGFLRDVVPCDMGAFEAGGVPTAVAVRQSGTTAAPSITLLLLALCLTAITIKLRLPLR